MWPLLVTKMFRPMIAVGPQGVEIAIDDQVCRSRVAKGCASYRRLSPPDTTGSCR